MNIDKFFHKCPIIINNTWKLMYKIGSGSFGEIFAAIDEKTEKKYAVKLEKNNDKNRIKLYEEWNFYNNFKGLKGIPKIHFYGDLYDQKCLVMDLLGPSLEDLFNFCNRHFSLKTVCLIGFQMIEIIEKIHEKNYLHRDIKPANFVVGIDDQMHKIYLIDFGLSKQYRKTGTNEHIKFKTERNLTGTPRYVSTNTHRHYEQSRRDDLESICYVLIYFLNGSLPWQGIKASTKSQKYEKIGEMKLIFQVETLTKKVPDEFAKYLSYCKSLEFETQPDYSYLKDLFFKILNRENLKFDNNYDWIIKYSFLNKK